MWVITSQTRDQLERAARKDPVFLTLVVGSREYGDRAIVHWLERLMMAPSFRYAAFLEGGSLRAYIPANAFLADLKERLNKDGPPVSDELAQGRVPQLHGLRTDTLRSGATNREALVYLTAIGREDVAVTSAAGELLGLVTKADIARKYVEAMVTRV
jgi:hypothetical protein